MATPTHQPDNHDEDSVVLVSLLEWKIAAIPIIAALSASSYLVVFTGASDEPYIYYHRADAIGQVGIGTGLTLLWGSIALTTLALVLIRRLSRRWLALVAWASICMFYLQNGSVGYLSDIERFVIAGEGLP